MTTKIARAIRVTILTFAPLASFGLSGCHIIADRAQLDLQKIAEIPQAFGDGFLRDLQRYERVRQP